MAVKAVIFVLLIVGIIFGLSVLCLDYYYQNDALRKQIQQLEEHQILLMVPEAQAETIASWLSSHPDQTKAMLELASPGEKKAVFIGPNPLGVSSESSSLGEGDEGGLSTTDKVNGLSSESRKAIAVLSENAEGVKVISLPNGGIRVTTRSE